MLTIYDRASQAHVLSLDLDPQLRALLERRFAALNTIYGDLTDSTEWFIVSIGTTEDELIEELGFSLLTEPMDGFATATKASDPIGIT